MKEIDQRNFIQVMGMLADVLMADDLAQDYNQTTNSLDAIEQTIAAYKLNVAYFDQILVIREKFEKGLKKRYGVKMPTGLAVFTVDLQALLIKHKVPHKQRVVSGLIDTLCGVLGQKSGAIKFSVVGVTPPHCVV